jgi:hypothetical protein
MAADPPDADLSRMTVRELCNRYAGRQIFHKYTTEEQMKESNAEADLIVAELSRRCTPPPDPDAKPGSFGPHKPCVFCGNIDDMCRGLERSICAPCWNSGKRLPTDLPAPADALPTGTVPVDVREAAETVLATPSTIAAWSAEPGRLIPCAYRMARFVLSLNAPPAGPNPGQCPWDLPFDSICPKHGGPLAQCPAKQSPFAGLIGGYAAGTEPVKLGVEMPNELWMWDDRKLGDK